jgi:hypothetical protein
MRKIHLTLTILFVFFTVSLFAQDISGLWQGVSYHKGTTFFYVITMDLKQNGSTITGNALTVRDGFYGIQSIEGTVNNNIFSFADQATLESNLNSFWCKRFGNLVYDPLQEKLSSDSIETTNCLNLIQMEMYRLRIYADTTVCNSKRIPIRATGKNLRWYSDSTKLKLISAGDNINPLITQDTTFYVTQTILNTQSPAVPIKIRFLGDKTSQTLKIC